MRIMRACASTFAIAVVVIATACTPAVESQSSSATNPSAWSSNESDSQPTTAASSAATDKPTRWEHFDRLGTFRKAAARARSQHLDGEHDAEVLTSDEAAAYPALGPQRPLGVGSVLVEALYAPGKSDVAVYFAMVKQPPAPNGGWEYIVISSAGQVERRGALSLCARCHAEAPHDQVFGRPR